MPVVASYVIGVVLAIVATILIAIFIMPEKRTKTMNKFMYFLHGVVNFRTLLIDKILKICYILSTCIVVLVGFFMLFSVQETRGFYSIGKTWMGGYGLLLMILAPIVVRIFYEFAMMFILLVNNVSSINSKLLDSKRAETFDTEAKRTVKPSYVFCQNCGERYDENSGGCPKCSNK